MIIKRKVSNFKICLWNLSCGGWPLDLGDSPTCPLKLEGSEAQTVSALPRGVQLMEAKVGPAFTAPPSLSWILSARPLGTLTMVLFKRYRCLLASVYWKALGWGPQIYTLHYVI